jgi:hypothetical protein
MLDFKISRVDFRLVRQPQKEQLLRELNVTQALTTTPICIFK